MRDVSSRNDINRRKYDAAYFERQHRFGQTQKYRAELSELIGQLDLKPGDKTLDIGCGSGLAKQYIEAQVGCRIIALDAASVALMRLQEGYRVCGDAHHLPLKANSFDKVYMSHVIGHLLQPAEVLAEVRRVLRPGGRLAVVTPNRNFVYTMRPLNWTRIVRYQPDLTVRRLFTERSLRREFEMAGFQVENIYHCGKLPSLISSLARFRWLARFKERLVACAIPRKSICGSPPS